MKKTIRRLDSSGDTAVSFESTDARAAAEARALFDRLKGEGRVPFAVNRAGGAPDLKLASFDDTEAQTVFIPRIVAG